MYFCNICNYQTSISSNIKKHNNSQKHIIKNNINTITNNTHNTITINNDDTHFICINCNKQYKYINEFKKHCIVCFNEDNFNKDFQHKLEIEKLKNEYEFKIKDLECKIKDLEYKNKDLEYKNLKQILNLHNKIDNIVNNNTNNNTNSNNNNKITNNNITNINISKLEFLNTNFCNVLNIDDFIENYKNKYCLTEEETQILLDNSSLGGLENCITTLACYLQRIAHRMYTDIKESNMTVKEAIMPILLVDGSARSHYEKNETKWIRTPSMDKLKAIYNITNDQIFKHHKRHLLYNGYQRKKIQNGILKMCDYARLNDLQTDFYKKTSSNNDINNQEITNADNNNLVFNNDEYEEEYDYNTDENDYDTDESE